MCSSLGEAHGTSTSVSRWLGEPGPAATSTERILGAKAAADLLAVLPALVVACVALVVKTGAWVLEGVLILLVAATFTVVVLHRGRRRTVPAHQPPVAGARRRQ